MEKSPAKPASNFWQGTIRQSCYALAVIAAGLLIMGSLTFLVSQDLPANAKFDWFMGLLAVSMLLVIYFLCPVSRPLNANTGI